MLWSFIIFKAIANLVTFLLWLITQHRRRSTNHIHIVKWSDRVCWHQINLNWSLGMAPASMSIYVVLVNSFNIFCSLNIYFFFQAFLVFVCVSSVLPLWNIKHIAQIICDLFSIYSLQFVFHILFLWFCDTSNFLLKL